MTQHQELLGRVEKATGADREIDRDLAELAYPDLLTRERRVIVNEQFAWMHPEFGLTRNEPYTSDLNAAVALIERQLPGWWWAVGHYGPHGKCTANVSSDGKKHGNDVVGPTPALALIAALLRALQTGSTK